jgi:potassium-dependent mechanosensitive channel
MISLARALLFLALLGFAFVVSDCSHQAKAQEGGGGPAGETAQLRVEDWDRRSEQMEAAIEDTLTSISTLQSMREELVGVRSRAIDAQASGQSNIKEFEARLAALGPAPTEGATEPPEIAQRRATLVKQLGDARVPVVRAQEIQERASQLITDLDRQLIREFSRNLVTRGPSPVVAAYWAQAAREVAETSVRYAGDAREALKDSRLRGAVVSELPLRLLVLLAAVALTFAIRLRINNWIEPILDQATRPRTVAWILALRNLNRIILPTVGAGLLFAALKPDVWSAEQTSAGYFGVPVPVWYLIGASWLAGSLFAPQTANHRILPLDNAEARSGSRLVMGLGILLGCEALLAEVISSGAFSLSTQAVVYFPLLCLGSVLLWRAASIIRTLRRRVRKRAAAAQFDAQSIGIGLQIMDLSATIMRAAAIAAPVLALFGFLALARLLEFPLMQTLGLTGAAMVVFDLLSKTAISLVSPSSKMSGTKNDGGLIPVFVAILVFLACQPILSLIWGARPTDIAEAWRIIRDGVTIGGMTLSLSAIFKFLFAFGIIIAVARLLHTLLRGSILPRTRLDAGGRNAVLAGVSYTGFAIAAVAAISASGIDLTNLAIVAGALSVGIGFGLQTIVSNFVSGIILLLERPIKEGDWIEVGEFSGYVRGINVRSTEIETFDKASVIVPNADLVAGTVLNRTHSDMSGRLIVPVSVSYETDPRKVEEILLDIIEKHPLVLEDPPPTVLFMDFGPGALNFELRCRLRDVNFLLTVKSDVNFEICERFRKQGISVPFPQRDLHIRSAEGLRTMLEAAQLPSPPEPVTPEDEGGARPGA